MNNIKGFFEKDLSIKKLFNKSVVICILINNLQLEFFEIIFFYSNLCNSLCYEKMRSVPNCDVLTFNNRFHKVSC